MRTSIDEELRLSVINALRENMMIDASEIGVAVNQHVVTLTGRVHGYYQKSAAEKTARGITGIRGVAENLEVALPSVHTRNDTDITQAAAGSLHWNAMVPDDVQVTTENAWITLTGKTEWSYQKAAAEKAVRYLTGVKGVWNLIEVKQSTPSATIKSQIEETLKSASERDAKRITVENNDGVVTLSGTVRSWSERNDASRTAWNAPGVSKVENLLEIGF